MSRETHRLGLFALAAIAALGIGCKVKGERQPFTRIGPEAGALRAAFNAGAGKVRVVVLVAPT